MSITVDAPTDAPTLELPAVPEQPASSLDGLMLETVHAAEAAAIRLAQERDAARLRCRQLEDQIKALLVSCHARQTALTAPRPVRERQLLGLIDELRSYCGRLERLIDADGDEVAGLKRQIAGDAAAQLRPAGRRRRRH